MSAWTNGTYTRKGLSLLSKLTQGSSLKITKAVAGTGYVNPEILASQTAVTGIKQYLSFQAASYPAAGTCKLPVFLTNENVTTGYKARQIGLYAFDPDEGEILYFITQSEKGTEVPGAAEMPDYSATWTFYLHYGQADSVNVTVDPSHTVTVDMLNEVREIAESGVSVAKRGEVVRLDNASALPFSGLKLFGKTLQNGTPKPDKPVELVSVNKPTVTVCGKNLAVIKSGYNTSVNGVTISADPNKSEAKLNGTANSIFSHAVMRSELLQPGTYTVSVSGLNVVNSESDRLYVVNANTEAILVNYIRDGYPKTFTLREATVVRADMVFATGTAYTNKTIQIQIERGTNATEYEPYKMAQTVPCSRSLNGVPVSSGGNYTDENGQQWICDEIDFARGVYVRRVHSETVALSYDADYNRYVGQLSTFAASKYAVGSGIPLLSNILPFNPNASSTSNGTRISSSGTKMLIACYNGEELTSASVVYPIETPVETALTDKEREAYASLLSNNPTNTVLNDAGAWMEVNCVNAQHEAAVRMAVSGRAVESKEYPGCYFRIVNGETEWINPPMVAGVEYCTSERFFSQKVYCKAISLGEVGDNSILTVSHKIENISQILRIDGCAYAPKLNVYDNIISNISCDTTNVSVSVPDNDLPTTTVSIVMKYTKKT